MKTPTTKTEARRALEDSLEQVKAILAGAAKGGPYELSLGEWHAITAAKSQLEQALWVMNDLLVRNTEFSRST